MITIKGILLCLAFPVLPFIGTTLISMLYHYILSICDHDYDLLMSFKRSAAFAFKPTMFLYFIVWFVISGMLFGVDFSSFL